MRLKRRTPSCATVNLFSPPPQAPRPNQAAVAEARKLLKQLLLRLAAPPETAAAAAPPSNPNFQDGNECGQKDGANPPSTRHAGENSIGAFSHQEI